MTTEPEHGPIFFAEIATKKAAIPGWQFFRAWHLGDAFLVEGGVPIGVFRSGPRKGCPKWGKKNSTRVVVTGEEIRAAEKEYEATTGKCHRCGGSGKTIASSSVTTGRTYRGCKRCNASGKAKS